MLHSSVSSLIGFFALGVVLHLYIVKGHERPQRSPDGANMIIIKTPKIPKNTKNPAPGPVGQKRRKGGGRRSGRDLN